MHSLNRFVEKLTAWNCDTFGNIFKRKRRLQRRLDGVVILLDTKISVGLLKVESRLKREWADTLLQVEQLWMQKSRIDWLRLGDKNTKFFHTATLVRRARNKVERLQNEDGSWVTDNEVMKNMAVHYYEELFSRDAKAGDSFITCRFLCLELGI